MYTPRLPFSDQDWLIDRQTKTESPPTPRTDVGVEDPVVHPPDKSVHPGTHSRHTIVGPPQEVTNIVGRHVFHTTVAQDGVALKGRGKVLLLLV